MDRSQEIGNTILTLTTHNLTARIKVTVFRFAHMTPCHMTPHSPHDETFGGEGGPEWNTIMAPRKTATPVRLALLWWTSQRYRRVTRSAAERCFAPVADPGRRRAGRRWRNAGTANDCSMASLATDSNPARETSARSATAPGRGPGLSC